MKVKHKLGWHFEDAWLTECERNGERYEDPIVTNHWEFVTCKKCLKLKSETGSQPAEKK